MRIPRILLLLVAATVSVALLSFESAVAGDSCEDAIAAAKPAELLALPEAAAYADWLPPGVACTTEAEIHTSMCQWQTTISDDRMINDYRLIVAKSAPEGRESTDDWVWVFHCVDGQVKVPTHAVFHQGEKQDYAAYASPEKSRALITGKPPPFRLERRDLPSFGVILRGGSRGYVVPPLTPPPPPECHDLASADADRVLSIEIEPWHGSGFYRAGTDKWYAAIGEDRGLGEDRRLLDLKLVNHTYERPWCSDQVYVFGCIDGRLRPVLRDSFRSVTSIEEASGGKLVVRMSEVDPETWRSPNPAFWEKRVTYSWGAALRNYVLSTVDFYWIPRDKGAPPPCVVPTPAGETD